MTDKIKNISDHIMHHIANVSAEADNPAGLKFGRKMLLDTIRMQLDDTTHAQFDEALYQLINGKYLNPLGAHTVGIGRGKGIKKYDLSKFTRYTSITPAQLEAEQKAKAERDTKNTVMPSEAEASQTDRKAGTGIANPKPVIASAAKQSTRQANKPKQTLDEEITDIHQALDRLRQRLNKPTRQIQNLERKVQTLDGIADALTEPVLKRLLNEIKTDLQEIAA